VLTLERAVEIAMRQQPSLRQSKAQLEAAQGRVDLSRVARRPTVQLSAGLSANSGRAAPDMDTDMATGAPAFFTHEESTGLTASASWRIYDFGQTAANIRAAELTAEATAAALDTAGLDVRSQVETTYLEAVARRRLVQFAEATVKSEDAHLDQARRFVAAQAKDPIEVAQAQARDANAKSALAQAQSNEAIALANLRSAIGWVDPANSPIVSANWPEPSEAEPPGLAALVDTARKRRPEIVQLDKEIQAADANLTAAQAERRPVLSATARTDWSPSSPDWDQEPTWSAGLTLSWNRFDGGRASADSRIARANVRASTEAVTAAQAQLKLSEARYTPGLGSQIELADAQTAVTTAQGNLVQAEFQLANAWALLHRATAQP
jgi:outer membrane protein TolC